MNKLSRIALTTVITFNCFTAVNASQDKQDQSCITQDIKAKNVEIVSGQKDVVVKVVKSSDWLTNFSFNCKIFSNSLKGTFSTTMGILFAGLAIGAPFVSTMSKNHKIASSSVCLVVSGICIVEGLKAFSKARLTKRKKNKPQISLEVQKEK